MSSVFSTQNDSTKDVLSFFGRVKRWVLYFCGTKKVLLWDDKRSLFPCPAKFSGQGEIKLIEAEEKNLFVEKAKIAS